MTPTRCDECGAEYPEPEDSCQARFDQLLALDHSRQEPWGSRHGLAFAALALQHPRRFPAASVAQSRALIERVVVAGEPLARVIAEFRAHPRPAAPLPSARAHGPTSFAVTIADLGSFAPDTYPAALERWARAALGAPSTGAV
ncbi:MAG: hypothetical protein KF689_11660 [Gemmatimonadaceae bacterium]|nr:hypothetical protein [Gemmatimonadaceae bacterium]